MISKKNVVLICLLISISFISANWFDSFTGKVTDDSNFVLTDSFNFWEDQSSHSYSVSGHTSKGAYACEGDVSCFARNGCSDNSLRLGSCANGGGSVSLEVSVGTGVDEIMLGVKPAVYGVVDASRSVDIEVDGKSVDTEGVLFSKCKEYNVSVSGLSSKTNDGKVVVTFSDPYPGVCGGDPQLAGLKVYSKGVSGGERICEGGLLGDVDHDKKITIEDYNLFLEIYSGFKDIDWCADMDGNKDINSNDRDIIRSVVFAAENPPCIDSDGGDDIYVKGIIEGPLLTTGAKPIDYCLSYSEGTLVEYSCENTEGFYEGVVEDLYSKSVQCENGCENGACIGEEEVGSSKNSLLGDVNGNGEVNVWDSKAIAEYVETGAELQKPLNADVNADGKINLIDSFIIALVDVQILEQSDLPLKATLLGDVDENGKIDAEDAQLITEYVNTGRVNFKNPSNADVNADGKITSEDVEMVSSLVGSIYSECVSEFECVFEPAVCPYSGEQTKKCNDVKCGADSYEIEINCNPGECEGCLNGENCFSYGERFEFGDKESYCDIDGKIKNQKSKSSSGVWASCSKDYECVDNVCSGGKCFDVQEVLEENTQLRTLMIRFYCRLTNFLNPKGFNSCIINTLVEDIDADGVIGQEDVSEGKGLVDDSTLIDDRAEGVLLEEHFEGETIGNTSRGILNYVPGYEGQGILYGSSGNVLVYDNNDRGYLDYNSGTIEFWMKPIDDSRQGVHKLFSAGLNPYHWNIQIYGSQLLVERDFGDCIRHSNSISKNFEKDRWYKFTLTWSGEETKFYIDDVETGSFKMVARDFIPFSSSLISFGDESFVLDELTISKESSLPNDIGYIRSSSVTCPGLNNIIAGDPDEKYRGIEFHNFESAEVRNKVKEYIDVLPKDIIDSIKHVSLVEDSQYAISHGTAAGNFRFAGRAMFLKKSLFDTVQDWEENSHEFFHEAGHAYIYDQGLNYAGPNGDFKRREWAEISGIDAYAGECSNGSVNINVHDGFLSDYGAKMADEDLAEWVGHTYDLYLNGRTFKQLFEDEGVQFGGVYQKKIDFLLEKGFISQDIYDVVMKGL